MRITLILLILISIFSHFDSEQSSSDLLNKYGSTIFVIEVILLLFLVFFKFPTQKTVLRDKL